MGHGASGMGHGASGIGHGAWGIGHGFFLLRTLSVVEGHSFFFLLPSSFFLLPSTSDF
ncbi:MAG: hypothetical protein QQW96_01305 [Tychonema bourrellyi B0820]|nr:hypothetical protein [Tychonema bourrellyi B0820]